MTESGPELLPLETSGVEKNEPGKKTTLSIGEIISRSEYKYLN